MKLLKLNLIIPGGMLLFSLRAFSCPLSLQKLQTRFLPAKETLCTVYDRYEKAVENLRQQGVTNPDRISEILAPRFIDRQTWEKKKIELNYDPRSMYQPAPQTWAWWELGKEKVDQQAALNKTQGYLSPLSLDWIREIQALSLEGPGSEKNEFRTSFEIGTSLRAEEALSRAQIETLLATSESLKSESLQGPFIKWIPTDCLEAQSQKTKDYMASREKNPHIPFQLSYWPAISRSTFFQDENGAMKQCGYIIYLSWNEVPMAMEQWLSITNQFFAKISAGTENSDFLLGLSKMQRYYIAIHPFSDGNGRTSRFILDLSLQSLGLPPPVFEEMNHDLDITAEVWASHLGRGILNHVEWVERCSKNLNDPQCHILDK